MRVAPRIRRTALVAHITASVSWVGGITTFLALAIVGMSARDVQLVRAVHLAAEPIAAYVIVPLALTSLFTGLVSAVVSPWGLLRHYWVVVKLVINLVATIVLLMYTPTVSSFAAIAADPTADLGELRSPTFVLHSGGALVLLLAATALAVFKPRGMTRYGQRAEREHRALPRPRP